MYPDCGIMVFQGLRSRNSIIPHKGYNPYTLENHSTADLYYDATTQTLGSVSLPQSLYFTMQLGCIVYEISRVHGFCTSCFSFEVWLHHSTKMYVHGCTMMFVGSYMSLKGCSDVLLLLLSCQSVKNMAYG